MQPQETFNRFLKAEGIRQSKQRTQVLEVFLKSKKHLSAAELYALVKKDYADIGYATVYRAMKVICRAGLAEELDFGDGCKRFERKFKEAHHDHLICTKCGKLIEVINPKIEELQIKMSQKHGFKPLRHEMQVFGLCRCCRRK